MVDKGKGSAKKKPTSSKGIAKQAIKNTTAAPHKTSKPQTKPAAKAKSQVKKLSKKYIVSMSAGFLLIVFLSFVSSTILVNLGVYILFILKMPILELMTDAGLQFVVSFLVYFVALIFTVVASRHVMKQKTTLEEVGLTQRLPRWRDIGLAPAVFIAYMIVSGIFLQVVMYLFPDAIDTNQQQAIGFDNITTQYELIAAYLTLTVLAPIAEELLFRGYLQGKLRKYLNVTFTIGLTTVLFAILHVVGITEEGQIQMQWAAVFDVFVLSIALGILREKTGSIWAGIILHSIKNTIAFFILFVYPYISLM